jgi:gliding motility-associated-like protein
MRKIIMLFFYVLNMNLAFADDPYCTNLSFEMGNFTNWRGFTWVNSTEDDIESTSPVESFGKHKIMSDTTEMDANTGNSLRTVPPGYKFSARLGDRSSNTTVQTLRYTLLVDSLNSFLTYKFAVVLLNPLEGHEKHEEPRFKVNIYDENEQLIPDCSNYDVFASDAELSNSFNTYYLPNKTEPVLWRDWTTVGANLTPYLGQTITIEFLSADCTHKGHYGYAYLVADCHPLNIAIEYCGNDSTAVLTAPVGYLTYEWRDQHNTLLSNKQVLQVDDPDEGSVYSCSMHSATHCTVTLNSTIERFDPKPDFSTAMLDCHSNEVQFSNTSASTKGTLSYKWNFGDGGFSTEENPRHKFASSGMHDVSLELSNPPSVCSVVLTKMVESFSPPLVGIGGDSTYCNGVPAVLKAYGAFSYKWSNGSEADSLIVPAQSGSYWMVGFSSTGCISDTVYQVVTEDPDWDFTLPHDAIFCEGDSAFIQATGAVAYLWNTGQQTSDIFVKTPGNYSLTAFNQRGCIKTKTIQVLEDALPSSEFQLSRTAIDSRNNQLGCIVLYPESDVEYEWLISEQNSTATKQGKQIIHTYTDLGISELYDIQLTATKLTGCTTTTVKQILVQPFVPNIFTPNNDGVNDLFAKGIQIQVIDRYGMVLYSGSEGWDGKYKNKYVDQDTYFYFLTFTDYLGNVQTQKGSVAVFR